MRIGSVPYLNGRPLVRWFWDTEAGRQSGVEVVEAVPSELARRLEQGELAVALVSSFERFRQPNFGHVPGLMVGADGAVLSVRLFSRVPLEQIQSVALDTSSLTSVALLRILLAERYRLAPQYVSAAPDLPTMLTQADAALLIGDKGYERQSEQLYTLDLGEAWKTWTGFPFAYALWIGRHEAITPELTALLHRAKAWGVQHFERIVQAEYAHTPDERARSLFYLQQIMRYDLDARAEQALALFEQKCRAHSLLKPLGR